MILLPHKIFHKGGLKLINLQFLRGLISKKPKLKDGQAYVDKTNHRLIIGDTSHTDGEFSLVNFDEVYEIAQRVGNIGTNLQNAEQDIADIQTDYFKTAGGNTLTASKVVVTDANGKASAAAVTAAELDCLGGVRFPIQTQLNLKITDPLTKQNGQALIYNSTQKAWEAQDIPGGGNFNTVADITVSTTWDKSITGLFFQRIPVTGETDTDAPMAFPQWTASIESEQAAWNKLEPYVESGDEYVEFWTSEKTTTAVNVKLYYTA